LKSDNLSGVRGTRILFSLATFVGSALLFLIQPMAAKLLLPIFGGSPAVWTASMLFFQVALLGGYAYAHFSNAKLGPPRQRWVHLVLLALALLTLPVSRDSAVFRFFEDKVTTATSPPLLVFGLLFTTVGAGYFMVSTGSPVLQRWFATTDDPAAKDPYFMYALSNAGSMLGLFAYPFLIEPRLGLAQQASLWRWGFLGLIVLVALCAFSVRGESTAAAVVEPPTVTPITWQQRRKWMFLAAIPSSLLLGATSYIGSNVAPIPLIWVVPLAVYLLTFVLAFASKPLVTAAQIGRILPLLVLPLAFTLCIEANEPLPAIASFHIIAFGLAAWMCHARLAEGRPEAQNLTEFYLWLSVGGAIGGSFNALIAPVLFSNYSEYPLAIALACIVRPQDKERPKDLVWALTIGAICILAMSSVKLMGMPPGMVRNGIGIGVPLVAAYAAVDRVRVFAVLLAVVFFGASLFQIAAPGKVLTTKRSFFGVHRVLENKNYLSLVHGNTTHGRQSTDPKKKLLPLTYYHPTGPVGQIFTKAPNRDRFRRVGLVGLGVGSLASYGQPGQEMTYFEIDPEVLYLARDSGIFSFLKSSAAKMRYVLGDARLTLAKEPDASYDLLILDAFSSDAIPTHLLTVEALQMYNRKLAPGGLIAFHISNRYLELEPVLAITALKAGLVCYEQTDAPVGEEETDGKTQSKWAILVRDRGERDQLWKPAYWNDITIGDAVKPWTDDYVNVMGAFAPEQ
jgi:SAM-dependent methyltransferase